MNYYTDVLKKYAVFSGRATRKEYWMFVLFNFIISIAVGVIGFILKIETLSFLYSLAIIIPSIAVGVRRLHDTDHSGWWIFIFLIPFIGAIILLVFFVTDSQVGENKYGQNPKGAIVG
ncbi:MAG: DUF805 domain-containing protein [Candidatus Yonathbacteria bacterium]|nr:DUF805 domain-containing protein [Candidatus Yonathbacteria bacterium]